LVFGKKPFEMLCSTISQISKVMDEHPRQPNDQGRVVAPPITGNKLMVIYFTRF